MAVLSWLRRSWPLVVVIGYAATLYIYGSTQRGVGYATAKAEGDQALTALRLEYAEQRAAVADEGALRLRQQIARADQAEQLMQQTQQQLADAQRQLQERIPHVTTVYRPAPDVAPVAIPRCVFTRGWLRDYNAALGADLPTARTSGSTTVAEEAPRAAPGADTELLESGITPADILAHAQDYGRWALGNAAQLHQLLDLQEGK
ncbi:TPA: lysis protein [Pseudomonas aeruginosa]|uniref:hypothetical protein n=1 Tax=Pseudomonas aeruginosa TaxID=287 RepID=UPI0002D9F578|nr:hypothetical protein [Pseudomonas aeruginosa]MDG0898751.1 lysis protein [Pseudomonas sp. L01]EIU2699036.1 lysis protein [Pseudomonas aeruginosa]ELM3776256.1 lysis protein [Pseudomonas aeruginosa]ELM3841157.1 lysis protein [Pseudomonas aeruginosa]ELP2773210.1 lysis protein [Pseudomonas aeruginosa]